jgi:hypothetical protein
MSEQSRFGSLGGRIAVSGGEVRVVPQPPDERRPGVERPLIVIQQPLQERPPREFADLAEFRKVYGP